MLISCMEEINSSTPSNEPKDEYTVSMNEAIEIAASFVSDKHIMPTTKGDSPTVKMAFSIKDKANEPLLSDVNHWQGL